VTDRRPLPWSDTCFVCGESNPSGLRVRFEMEGDEALLAVTVDGAFDGYPGVVHGGVVSAMLDETIGWACTVAAHRLAVTVELTVRFRRPVPSGRPLVVRGRLVEIRRNLLVGEGEVVDGEDRVLATGRGVYAPLPEERSAEVLAQLRMPGRPAGPGDV